MEIKKTRMIFKKKGFYLSMKTMDLPTAAAAVAMSRSMWSPSMPGAAREMGRVEKREVALRVGAT